MRYRAPTVLKGNSELFFNVEPTDYELLRGFEGEIIGDMGEE